MVEPLREYRSTQSLITRSDLVAREIDVRLLEWDVPADLGSGALESFSADTRIHTAGGPVDAIARLDHADPPFGRVTRTWSTKQGPFATIKASRTVQGDTALELAQDGTYKGPSIGFLPSEPSSWAKADDGRPIAVRSDMDLREVSLTWRPAHQSAAIVAVRSTEGPGMEPVTGPGPTPAAPDQLTPDDVRQLIAAFEGRIGTRFDALEERARRIVDVPSMPGATDRGWTTGEWVQASLAYLSGDRAAAQLATRALADVITTGNEGVVPANVRSELLGIIDPARPFLQSTRKVDAGGSGMTQTFPRIKTRPLTGKQSAEKAALPSRATEIETVDYQSVTIGGAGDLSMQLIRRSTPAFMQLWLELVAESMAINADDEAVDALLAAGVTAGTGTWNPAAPSYGEAFANGLAVGRSMLPDSCWVSSAAYAAYANAKTPAGGGGTAMYPGLVDNGISRPILTPALDDEAVDIILGPAKGFAWAEDGSFQLVADVPEKFGRDVGLASIFWFMPVYPAAFTTYALAP
jgi:HK97 family phage prohead protease